MRHDRRSDPAAEAGEIIEDATLAITFAKDAKQISCCAARQTG